MLPVEAAGPALSEPTSGTGRQGGASGIAAAGTGGASAGSAAGTGGAAAGSAVPARAGAAAGPRVPAVLLAAVGAGGTVVALELPASPRIAAMPAPVVLSTLVLVFTVAGLALCHPVVRWAVRRLWLPYVAAAVAAGLAAWGWWAAGADRFGGFPGVRTAVFAVSATLLTLGLVGSGGVAHGRRQRTGVWQVWFAVGVVLAAGVAVPLVPPVVAERRMGESAAGGAPTGSPAAVAWQRRYPDLVDAVAIATNMVAVTRATGVVEAVDSVSGRTRWRYSRRYARVPAGRVRVAPDGRTLVVVFSLGPRSGGSEVAVVLDARTGRERWHRAADRPLVGVTDSAVLFVDRKSRYLFAHDLRTGRMRWAWVTPAPSELYCRLDRQPVAAFPDRIAVASRCEGLDARKMRTYVLADRDAHVLSSFEFDQSGGYDRFAQYSAPARMLLVTVRGAAAASEYHLIDAGAGERVAAFADPGRTLLSVDDRGLLWRHDRTPPGQCCGWEDLVTDLRGEPAAALPAPAVSEPGCAPRNAAWTGTHLVVLCAGRDQPLRVVTTKLDGTPGEVVELPGPVRGQRLSGGESGGEQSGEQSGGEQSGVELVGRGAGHPGLSAGATVVLDRANGILLGLG